MNRRQREGDEKRKVGQQFSAVSLSRNGDRELSFIRAFKTLQWGKTPGIKG